MFILYIFGSWTTTVEATPISSGTQSRSCQICWKTETKDYTNTCDKRAYNGRWVVFATLI